MIRRWRITVRADNVELRGRIDCEYEDLEAYAKAAKPIGLMIASLADDDYDPFKYWNH